jgi:hypothetical protein
VWQRLLVDARLFLLLGQLDADLAAEVQAGGCECGGRLHGARYPRKPRGVPPEAALAFAFRHSFCCAAEGCRRRKTPISVRFLGRRVYVAVVVLLASAAEGRLTRRRCAALQALLGVSERTLRRWRSWWRAALPRTAFWREARAGFVPPIDVGELPGSLVARFSGRDETERIARVARFLAPLAAAPF